MTNREKCHALVDSFTEEQLASIVEILESAQTSASSTQSNLKADIAQLSQEVTKGARDNFENLDQLLDYLQS